MEETPKMEEAKNLAATYREETTKQEEAEVIADFREFLMEETKPRREAGAPPSQ